MFGTKLKQLREEKKLTQNQLAEILDISRPAITKYERDERQPDFELLSKIADYFNVTTDYLLGRTAIRNNYEKDSVYDLDNNKPHNVTFGETVEAFVRAYKIEHEIDENKELDPETVNIILNFLIRELKPYKKDKEESPR